MNPETLWKAFFLVLLVSGTDPSPASFAQQNSYNQPPSHIPIYVYQPVGTYLTDGSGQLNPLSALRARREMDEVLAQVSLPIKKLMMPVYRALDRYDTGRFGCLLGPLLDPLPNEINSGMLAQSRFWLFVLADRGIQSRDDIRVYATIAGADALTQEVKFPDRQRLYVPNYQGLLAILLTGRADAVTFGESALDPDSGLPDGVIPLEQEPFIVINNHLRCHATPRTRRLIDEVDAILARKKSEQLEH